MALFSSSKAGRGASDRFDLHSDADWDLQRQPSFWQTPGGLITTVVLVVAVVGLGAYILCPLMGGCNFFGPKVIESYSTELAETESISLADGSQIVIGPLSKLEVYEGEQQVNLKGTGVFRITPNVSRNFVIRANNTITTVLGIDSAPAVTEFAIRGFPKDTATSIGVIEGRIRLGEVVILNTGNVADVAQDGKTVVTFERHMGPFTGWTEGNLDFSETPLRVVGNELTRWFDVEVKIPDTTMWRDTVTAKFPIDSISAALKAVSQGAGVNARRVGRVITFERARRVEQ